MSWILVLLVALLAGGLGLVLGGLVMMACVVWYEISSFEGKAGFALVGVALLGGIFGFGVGLVAALVVPGDASVPFLRALGLAAGLLLALAALAAGIARLLADVPPKLDGKELELEVEIRLPARRTTLPSLTRDEAYVELGALRGRVRRTAERGILHLADARREDGRWILPAEADVFTGRGKRLLTVHLGDEPVFGFLVPLPGRPRRRHLAWSDWLPGPRLPETSGPEDQTWLRFRVRAEADS